MKTPRALRAVLAFYLVSATSQVAMAWDSPGHMAVAGVAYDELPADKQERLVGLLQKHPAWHLVLKGFPDKAPAPRDLAMAAATWADLVKGSKEFQDNGYEEHEPAVTVVQFDHLMHKGWHFIDTPLWVGCGPVPATLPAAPAVNAVGVVCVLLTQLHSAEPDEAKAYDLAWLLHLVGDLHQPLHAVTGISEALPKGDVGGNDVVIYGATLGEKELHAFWDDILGKYAPLDDQTHLPRLDKDAATAAGIISSVKDVELGDDAGILDPRTWAAESMGMARQDVYTTDMKPISQDGRTMLKATLDKAYDDRAAGDARKRIRVAGHRLALLLGDILK